MQLFQPSVVQVDPSSFNPEAYHHIHQLSLTTDLSSIIQTVQAVGQHVYYIYGEPGSGCTTLVQGIYQHVCSLPDSIINCESDVLYLSLNQLCTKELFEDFIVQLVKLRNGTVLLKQSSKKIDERKQIIGEFFHENFKVIFIDNGETCCDFIDEFLVDVLKASKIPCFVVFNKTKEYSIDSNEAVSSISVHGLKPSDAKSLACKELQPLTLPEDQLSKMCDLVHNNPAAIQVVCGILTGFNETDHIISVLQNMSTSSSSNHPSYAMDIIVELIKKVSLLQTNVDILHWLSCLCRPLPILEIPPVLEELIKMKLLSVSQEGDVNWVSCSSIALLKKYLEKRKMPVSDDSNGSISVLALWFSLVSDTLQSLVDEAENNAWPFVPEKW